MHSVRTSVSIAAPPDAVWRVLTDFSAYPQWNEVIRSVRTEARVGAPMRFTIQIEGMRPLPLAAKIVRCAPGRELAWRGGAPIVPGLAWGEHYFELAPSGDGTQLTHGENFGGLLGLLVRGVAHARVVRTYEALNRAIKARAEGAR
jgi:hypothetical protein